MNLLLDREGLLHKHIAKIPKIPLDSYRYWLFSQPHSIAKDHLLEITLLQSPIKEEHHVYYQMTLDEDLFSKALKNPLDKPPAVYFSKDKRLYQSEGHFYLELFQSQEFGAHFRGFSEKNEEILFCEFPLLTHLAFALETSKEKIITPFLIPHVKRALILENDKITSLDHLKEPYIHLLGINQLNFKQLFLAFEGATLFAEGKKAAIHVPLLEKTPTMLLLAAAALTEVDIIFEGVENEAFLEECKRELSTYKTAQSLLDGLSYSQSHA